MTWMQLAGWAGLSVVIVWWIYRSRGQHRGGYLLALDHVEQMTRGKLTGRPLPEVLKTLRGEVSERPDRSNER